jgi:calcineurin-like phosphoesterase family protein
MNIWFSADQHFSHANIIKYANRPYASAEEMDEALIANWNSVVGPDDLVYVLGDFCFKGRSPDFYLRRLLGDKILILGNHDKENVVRASKFKEVHKLLRIFVDGHHIIMSHYAMRVWDMSHHGSWHLYGHSHGKLPGSGRSFDCGVDCWNYFPISYDTVRKTMEGLDNKSRFVPPTAHPATGVMEDPVWSYTI